MQRTIRAATTKKQTHEFADEIPVRANLKLTDLESKQPCHLRGSSKDMDWACYAYIAGRKSPKGNRCGNCSIWVPCPNFSASPLLHIFSQPHAPSLSSAISSHSILLGHNKVKRHAAEKWGGRLDCLWKSIEEVRLFFGPSGTANSNPGRCQDGKMRAECKKMMLTDTKGQNAAQSASATLQVCAERSLKQSETSMTQFSTTAYDCWTVVAGPD